MTNILSTDKLYWKHKPKLFVLTDERVVLETEPFSSLHGSGNKDAIELIYPPQDSFMLHAKCEFVFNNTFDQCGLVIYEGKKRKAIVGVEAYDEEISKLQCVVYHDEVGDSSTRDIGQKISCIHYRVWARGGAIRVQYSFTGRRYSDLRSFRIGKNVEIGLFACSPTNSIFDCTFSELECEEEK